MADNYHEQRQWNWRNFILCCVLNCGLLAFGYTSSIIATTLAQPAFLLYMKLIDPKTGSLTSDANGLIGATNGVFQAGAFFGVLVGSWFMDRFGRKLGVVFCAVLTIIGGVCTCAAQDIGMFIAFRFFAGFGSWGFLALSMFYGHENMSQSTNLPTVAPIYVAELAPPKLRGLFVGMGGMGTYTQALRDCILMMILGITTGYAIASYMGLAFNLSLDSHPSAQWRGPLGLQCFFPVFMLVVLPFLPESP